LTVSRLKSCPRLRHQLNLLRPQSNLNKRAIRLLNAILKNGREGRKLSWAKILQDSGLRSWQRPSNGRLIKMSFSLQGMHEALSQLDNPV
jgi:hypothetical protein